MNNEIDILIHAQTKLAETVLRLEQQMYFQHAVILGIRDYLSVMSTVDKAAAPKAISALARKNYDRIVVRIGDSDPAHAERIDIRPSLSDGDTDFWQFP